MNNNFDNYISMVKTGVNDHSAGNRYFCISNLYVDLIRYCKPPSLWQEGEWDQTSYTAGIPTTNHIYECVL